MATRARRFPRSKKLSKIAASPVAKAAYIAMAGAGLAALAIGIFGPRRFQQQILQPIGASMSDQAEKIWSEAQPLRTQLGGLIERAGNDKGREKLIRSFQSWIGHFRAT